MECLRWESQAFRASKGAGCIKDKNEPYPQPDPGLSVNLTSLNHRIYKLPMVGNDSWDQLGGYTCKINRCMLRQL